VSWIGYTYARERFLLLLYGKSKLLLLTDAKKSDIEGYFKEAAILFSDINNKTKPYSALPTGTAVSPLRGPILYTLCRSTRPEIVIETGVANGGSSAFILGALEKNGRGHLYSIDIHRPGHNSPYPDEDPSYKWASQLPEGKDVGWLIPEDLRRRWTLVLGKTQEKLPELLSSVKDVDIFFHDSDHSYNNMAYEFRAAWPHIRKNGYLVSDDIDLNGAFSEFLRKSEPSKYVIFRRLGVLRK